MTNKKFIFIVGPQRTGTTYMLFLLLEHELIGNPLGRPYETTVNEKTKRRNMELLDKYDGKYVVCKNPDLFYAAKHLLNEFKDCLLIFTIRNPLEMYVSSVHMPLYNNNERDERTLTDRYVEACKSGLELIEDKRVIFVHYKDLFENPEEILKKVLDKIELKYDDKFIKKVVADNRFGQKIMERKRKVLFRVGQYTVDSTISKEQQQRIKDKCWKHYEKLLKHCI